LSRPNVLLVAALAGAIGAAPLLPARALAGDLPPWSDALDIPVPRWAKSVAPHNDDVAVFRAPSRAEPRRGTLNTAARPPLYGALRGPGCAGRWLQIGPAAWTCSDDVELAADDPPSFVAHRALPPRYTDDGLGFRFAFVGPEGARAFRDLAHAEDEASEADLDPGFAVAITEEREAHGKRWAETRHGKWISMDELIAARPVTLHGEALREGAPLDVAWVMPEHAATYADPQRKKSAGVRLRFELVHRYAEEKGPNGPMVRTSEEGAAAPEWMRARDLAHPTPADPPAEVGGKEAVARWIDVDLATETLVAYEGTRPVYAALVATGRGPQGSEMATPKGVHHIWVKLLTSSMGNLGDEDAETHYSIEDVPYVQFFAKGVALHGAFWHHSFGAAHSHGCVNLAPVDARWLFDFTAPELPAGWTAVLPAGATDPGTVVRVR
jgi:hypothetical protein